MSTRRSQLAHIGGIVMFVAAALVTGCANTCTNPEEVEDNPYRLRTSPDNVVYNLTYAYKAMDTEGYIDCMAENFEFHLNPGDYEEPGSTLPSYWGKPEEQAIHEAMFGDGTDVERINLTITNLTKDFNAGEDPLDPADDTWTYLEEIDLRVTVSHDDLTYLASAYQDFVFQIDPDETGPEGETLWELVEWWDLPDPDARVESSTWGSIKSMYR